MVLRLLTLRLPLAISFEDSAEHRQSVAWPSGDRDRVANSEQAERQAADEYREDTERKTSTASRCELLRGELIYDFELWFPPFFEGGLVSEFIQRRPIMGQSAGIFSPEHIVPSLQEASNECGTLSSIPWCAYILMTDPDCLERFLVYLHELDNFTDRFNLTIGVNAHQVEMTTTTCPFECLDFPLLVARLPSWQAVKESGWPIFAAIARLEQFLQYYVTDLAHLWAFAPWYLRRSTIASEAQLQKENMFYGARVIDFSLSSVLSKFVAGLSLSYGLPSWA